MAIAYLRHLARRYKFVWLLCLSLTLIGIQSANLHLDVYDHHHHGDETMTSAHNPHSSTHMCGTACNGSHNHENVTELEITPEGVVKSLSFGSLILALFTFVVAVLLVQRQCLSTSHPRNISKRPWWQLALRPPLRAPPL